MQNFSYVSLWSVTPVSSLLQTKAGSRPKKSFQSQIKIIGNIRKKLPIAHSRQQPSAQLLLTAIDEECKHDYFWVPTQFSSTVSFHYLILEKKKKTKKHQKTHTGKHKSL